MFKYIFLLLDIFSVFFIYISIYQISAKSFTEVHRYYSTLFEEKETFIVCNYVVVKSYGKRIIFNVSE